MKTMSVLLFWMTATALLLCAPGGRAAADFGPGECPDIPVVQDFEVERYVGLWYEVSRQLPALELGMVCPKLQYSLDKNSGEIAATYTIVSRGSEKERFLTGKASPVDPKKKEGLYIASVDVFSLYLIANLPVSVPYRVVGTDYENYAVVYTCISAGGLFHGGGGVILSRTPKVSAQVQAKIDRVLQEAGLDKSKFSDTDQHCHDAIATSKVEG